MKVKSKHTFKCCDPEQVWDKLMDVDRLGSIITEGKGLKKVGRNKYKGKLPLKMPVVKGDLATTFRLKGVDTPNEFRLNVRGKNGNIRVSSRGTFKLSQEPDTVVTYEGRLKLYFKLPAGIEAGMPGPVNTEAKKSLEQALASLLRKIDRQCCEENHHAH